MKIKISLILFFIFVINIYPDIKIQIKEKEQKLKEVEERLKKSKAQSEYLEKKEGEILNYLNSLRQQIESLDRKKKYYASRLNKINSDLKMISKDIGELDKELKKYKEVLSYVFYDSFVNHERSKIIDFMPNTGIMSKKKMVLLAILGEKNYKIKKNGINKHEEMEKKLEKKKEIKDNLRLNYLNMKISEKKLLRTKNIRNNTLNKIRNKKEYYNNLIAELKSRKAKLNGLLDKLEKRAVSYKSKINFINLKGDLIWPVEGTIYQNYGKVVNNRYNTSFTNSGIDIKTGYNAPVSAVANGIVVYAESFISFGKTVMLDHGNGYYTIYTNLSKLKIATGNKVNAGQIIGLTGNNLIDGAPILHFEIRHKKRPLSPLAWLK